MEEFHIEKILIRQNWRFKLCQRGIGNPNPIKLGRCIKELERIYGIKNGGDRGNQYKEADSNNYNLPTQSELAERLGISISYLQNYKKLTEKIPELDELLNTSTLQSSHTNKK